MILMPECYDRKCIHFLGIEQPDGTEETERPVCLAFPDGIPDEIAYGKNKHLTPIEGQDNDIIFTKE